MLTPCPTTPTSGVGAEKQVEPPAQNLPVREEINQTFQFARFARIDVSGLAGGPVNIETIDGNTVEVRLLRSAQTKVELDCYRTIVENTPDSLTIRHQQDSSKQRMPQHTAPPRAFC